MTETASRAKLRAVDRRTVLKVGGATAAALALPMPWLFRPRGKLPPSLRADPRGILDLPPGFSYRVLSRAGDAMSDGYRVPALADGMACFTGPKGTLVLMRNHEIGHVRRLGALHEGQAPPKEAYDASAHGGVTRIVLSAKSSVDSRVLGLETGADDYLTKPFSFSELNARLQAILRRRAPAMAAENELTYKDLRLDLKSRKVTRGDATVELAAKEFTLLEYLLRNPERVLSKTMILEHVWGYDFDPQTNVVDVLVHRLRNHVDRGFETTLIQTLRGIGYVLRAE